MKLFKKIFLQVFIGCLLLSEIPFLYFLYESQRQSLEDTAAYEQQNFHSNCVLFSSNMSRKGVLKMSLEIMDLAAINEFRNIFGSNGALYQGEEELFNSSPYEFDWKEIAGRDKESLSMLEEELSNGILNLAVRTVNGRKLQIFNWSTELITIDTENAQRRTYGLIYYKDVTDIYERTESLFLRGLCFTLASLAVIGVVLFMGIYRSFLPLRQLRSAAASIADGDYKSRVPIRGRDEIAELAENFNRMAKRVEEHVEELSNTNEAQRRLIGSLAHELKTPLTAIIGYSDTLLTVELSEKRRIQALSYIRSESMRLSRLAEKMMELTGLYESGDMAVFKETRVDGILRQLQDLTAYRLKEKNITLATACTPRELTLRMDEDLIMSLLMNLVDNAFKASREHSAITVSADARGFVVEDQGKGIPASDIARVTEAFYMVDKSRSRSAGGVGLGLAFCQQIADLHNARLVIESEDGKGTRVSVLWPERSQ